MPSLGKMTLKGASGKDYTFEVYHRSTEFKALGAVYLISKRSPNPDGKGGTHTFLYLGETGDLSSRPLNHHKKQCFDKHGADHVSVFLISDSQQRLDAETDLIRGHNLPCNG